MKNVRIVNTETGFETSVPESAFRKVWSDRGYELLEDVQARRKADDEDSHGETEVVTDSGEQVAASTDKGAAQTEADKAAAEKTAADAANQKVGETAKGDSKQSSTPNV